MKGKSILWTSLALLAAGSALAEMRTWNLKSGATVEAEIVAFPSMKTVTVKRADGKVYTLQDAYLTDEDRDFLATERAKQWKEVSVDKLLGSISAGHYKKCFVSGKDVSGQILVTLLPAQVEPVLNKRQEQEAQVAALNNRIQNDESIAHKAGSSTQGGKRNGRTSTKPNGKAATQDEDSAKGELAKLKAEQEDFLKKTKASTTLMMRNTGTMYEGFPVWECQPPQK